MQVNVTQRPGSVVQLDIELPTEQVERAIERAFNRVSPRVRVPGFRPGKAPRAIIEKQIGWPALRQEAMDLVIPEALSQAVVDHKLEAITTPEVDVEQFERLQPARFKALVTVRPTVTLGDVKAVKVPLEKTAVTPDQVDKSIEELRRGLGVLAPAENRPVQEGDHLVVDLEVLREGVPVDEQPASDMEMDVDSTSLIPGLAEAVIGMNAGETRDIPLTLPDDYRRSELAGQPVVFHLTVKEVKERQLPELDDELARTAGAGDTLAELRQRVEERLASAIERDAVFAQQKAALDALVNSSTFEVPEVLVEGEIDREIRNLAVSLGQQGIDFDKFIEYGGADLNQMREERRQNARERVAQELVLDALAETQGLEPSPEHIDSEARRTLAGAPDAEKLLRSDRVQAYVRERLRLQWALLWLAATARGEEWEPPSAAEMADQDGSSAAAEELLEQPLVSEPEPAPAEGGMVEL
jgi:trigger factor